jgi:hypothetical protein
MVNRFMLLHANSILIFGIQLSMHSSSFLRKFEFDYLVVDEGHTLKVSSSVGLVCFQIIGTLLKLSSLDACKTESKRSPLQKFEQISVLTSVVAHW